MTYYLSKTVDAPFDRAVAATVEALGKEGFGVLTDIDVAATMKAKIGADMAPYRILGACNPKLAYGAIGVEKRIGTMLPCNVLVFQGDDGKVEIAAVDPVASMQAIDNPELARTAETVKGMLQKAVDSIAL